MSQLEKYANSIQDIEIGKVSKVLKEIRNNINEENNKLPEYIFVKYFLPYFKQYGSTSDNPIIYKWLEIAGNVYKSVDIVDENKNVIFTVPPILARADIDITEDFSAIANTYSLKLNYIEESGNKYIRNVLDGMKPKIQVKENNIADKWLNIFNRYKTEEDKSMNQEKAPLLDDDFIDYD